MTCQQLASSVRGLQLHRKLPEEEGCVPFTLVASTVLGMLQKYTECQFQGPELVHILVKETFA